MLVLRFPLFPNIVRLHESLRSPVNALPPKRAATLTATTTKIVTAMSTAAKCRSGTGQELLEDSSDEDFGDSNDEDRAILVSGD